MEDMEVSAGVERLRYQSDELSTGEDECVGRVCVRGSVCVGRNQIGILHFILSFSL